MMVISADLVLVLLISFLFTVRAVTSQDNSSPSSSAKLHISPDTLGSLEYDHFGVNIYEHADNHKPTTPKDSCKYYFASISLLDHMSAVSFLNNAHQAKMRFRIYIWNEKLKEKVMKYVSNTVLQEVNKHQVELIPFENVILTSSLSNASFSLPNEWKPISNHQFVEFSLSCPKDCSKLASEMRSHPEKFDHFKLRFRLSSQRELPTLRMGVSSDSDFPRQGASSSKELWDLYQESKDHVEWDGEKLVPEPLELNRINLATLSDTQSFQDRKIDVNYTTAVLSTPINIAQHADLMITAELQSLKSEVENLNNALNNNVKTRDIEDIGRIPSSCSDLHRIGHTKSGLYSVMGTKTVETVYCQFFINGGEKQKWIGYNDVQSHPTYFFVQRNTPFFIMNIPIPFHVEKLNVGNAMNLKTGKFTAPRAGTYFFSFTGVAQFSESPTLLQLGVSLCLNGHKIGMGWVDEAKTANLQLSPLAIQSTAHLQPGDHVWVQIFAMSAGVSLFECCDHYFTLFSGWVLQEDIAKSLL